MTGQRIRIRLKAFDYRMLDHRRPKSSRLPSARAQKCRPDSPADAIEKFTVNRSPHVDKKSMDQFEIRTHKRLLDIIEPTAKTVDELKKLNLRPAWTSPSRSDAQPTATHEDWIVRQENRNDPRL